jgi:3-hydroxybutyryl-CoA dehydratase
LNTASFEVEVTEQDALAFAKVSGDWNPLHTDAAYAASTTYRRPVLHGAFSAGLLSRLAGMYLPGKDCLLHNLRLRFLMPIFPPAHLLISGKQVATSGALSRVDATVTDTRTGARYVEGTYEFSRHETSPQTGSAKASAKLAGAAAPILVTGATGGLGGAVLAELGDTAVGLSRTPREDLLEVPDLERIQEHVSLDRIAGIVHCAWPAPGNERLSALSNTADAVEFNLAAPFRQILALSQLLVERGTDGAMLVLIGSTAALPGRHNYRAPLYTLSKSLIPETVRILATEMAALNRRCVALTFDVIEGGMNKRLGAAARIAHADRVPAGRLPSLAEAAAQVAWVLSNKDFLVSGATISVTGAAAP